MRTSCFIRLSCSVASGRGWLWAMLQIALLGWWLWPKHPVSAPAAAVPVNAGHATVLDFPIRLAAVGTVQALNTVDVKVRVDGQLARVTFNEGQDVKAGQLLAQLDQGPLTAQLRQAEAAQRQPERPAQNNPPPKKKVGGEAEPDL